MIIIGDDLSSIHLLYIAVEHRLYLNTSNQIGIGNKALSTYVAFHRNIDCLRQEFT